jgi:hypothetical protein
MWCLDLTPLRLGLWRWGSPYSETRPFSAMRRGSQSRGNGINSRIAFPAEPQRFLRIINAIAAMRKHQSSFIESLSSLCGHTTEQGMAFPSPKCGAPESEPMNIGKQPGNGARFDGCPIPPNWIDSTGTPCGNAYTGPPHERAEGPASDPHGTEPQLLLPHPIRRQIAVTGASSALRTADPVRSSIAAHSRSNSSATW